jgi:predicted permease
MFALLLVLQRPLFSVLNLNGPQFSSLFQGATRWHTFIALAIIPIYFGQSALALGGLSAAAMTPLLNIVNVGVISVHGSGAKMNARAMVFSIVKNPFVLSSLGGVLWKLLYLPMPSWSGSNMISRGH